MARLATGHLIFPTADLSELGVGRVREVLELILMTVLARFTADIVSRLVLAIRFVQCEFAVADRRGLGRIIVGEPPDRTNSKGRDQDCFNESIHLRPLF